MLITAVEGGRTGADVVEDEQFHRVLRRADVLAIGVGSMIGFGWVVLAGEFITEAGSLGSALAFVLGGIVVGLVGLTYAELVAAMPRAGGEHHYALRALGARWAFVASWAVILGYVSVVAFESVALPETLAHLLDLPDWTVWTVAGSPVRIAWVAIGVLGAVVVTAANYVGVRPAGLVQIVAVVFLLCVGALLVTGAAVGGSPSNAEPWFTGATGIIGVVAATPFLFLGFDVIPQSAEEVRMPRARIGRLLLFAVACATAWYVLVQLTVGSGLTAAESAAAELPTAEAMAALWDSQLMGGVLVLGGAAGIVTSWNGLLLGASRLLYAMARSGMLPRWFARVHPRYGTPSNAILFIGAISVVSPLFGDRMLTWLSNAGSANIVIGYLLVGAAFLVLHRREPDLERPYRVRAPRTTGVLAVAASAALLLVSLPGMPAELAWPAEWIIVALAWGAGLVLLLRVPRVGPGADAETRLHERAARG
ncbi:APC family permease [Salinifilum ghardaiensis]